MPRADDQFRGNVDEPDGSLPGKRAFIQKIVQDQRVRVGAAVDGIVIILLPKLQSLVKLFNGFNTIHGFPLIS